MDIVGNLVELQGVLLLLHTAEYHLVGIPVEIVDATLVTLMSK